MNNEKPKGDENAGVSIQAVLAFSSRDWSLNHRDAWLWGIVNGWDGESMRDLAKQHSWTPSTVARLSRLHRQFVERFGLVSDVLGGDV